jgi:AraC-like DNA-binding protein
MVLINRLSPLDDIMIREKIFALRDQGHSLSQIASILGMAKSTIAWNLKVGGREVDKRFAQRYDWKKIRDYYEQGHTVSECIEHFGFNKASWAKAYKRGDIVVRPTAIPLEDVLVEKSTYSRGTLKRRLITEEILKNECIECGQGPEWNDKPLTLVIDHINGVNNDNRLQNLRILCPNCHTQTATFAGRNAKKAVMHSERA